MVKRSELHTTSIPLSVHRYDMKNIRSVGYDMWKIRDLQPFFPAIEKLFKTEHVKDVRDIGLRFQNEILSILSESTIRTIRGDEVPIHRKTTMLLSPYVWMRGEYGTSMTLPTSTPHASKRLSKLQTPNNAGYVGAMISAALSDCRHFPTIYGILSGIAETHTIDISDDYGDLSERPWFSKHIGTLFDIQLSDEIQAHSEFKHTRCARTHLDLGEDLTLPDIQELVSEHPIASMGDLQPVLQDEPMTDDHSDTSSVSTTHLFEIESCDCEDDDDDYEEDEDYEGFAWATFRDVPVQTTLMEVCEGTFHQLCVLNPDSDKHLAWMTQVIFALAYAQRKISFTHNDLHANNIMYVTCKDEYLTYNCEGKLYRVPTYGYLIKIIDFERGIASIKLPNMREPKLFMSDQYGLDEEASGMYNYGEFMSSKHAEIRPNPSVDLARLATSVYWDLFPDESDHRLCKMMRRWMSTEKGSVLFGTQNPKHDRYHGFELYKAIVRYCKDAVPRREIERLYDVFGVEHAEGPVLLV